MKTVLFAIVLSVTCFGKSKSTTTKIPPIVGDEFEKTHVYFLKTFRENKQNIEDLKKEKQAVIDRYKTDALFYEEGAEALNKYDLLLVVRNTDDKGEYEKANEVAGEDVRNLNAMFQKYLKATLLPDRVSARYARKVIAEAINELEAKADDCKDPNDGNNPELEILSKRITDATRKTELVTEFAGRIGIDIKRELASEPAKEETPKKK